jgi:hypothetical protein
MRWKKYHDERNRFNFLCHIDRKNHLQPQKNKAMILGYKFLEKS